jgi:predicted transport protein
VIIEFKRGNSWSVIDQGATYLSLLLDRRDSFVLKLNQVQNTRLMPKDIDWETSRVIFVAPSFNTYQEGSLGFRDLPIELWEILRYEKDLIALNRIQSSRKNAKLSELDDTSGDLKKVRREMRQYTVDDHFKEGWNDSRAIFDALLPQLMKLHPSFALHTTKSHISLKIGWRVVCYIHAQKHALVIDIARSRPKDFKDPEKRVTYIEKSMEHWGQHVSKFSLRSEDDVPYAIMLAKQVVKKYT